MVIKGGVRIFWNNLNGYWKSFLKNPPVKAAANDANTSRNKECNIDGQHRHLWCEIITALHSHHQYSYHHNHHHLQGLFYKKLGVLVCI